ncbi:MAG: 23S rRNA (guanosine(2251)-2'-O)-methyltransferase RlmB [Anaerolineae bacterium]|nr:23S rRNA (guanosine(2251)-2'-O)-methyltransferase RlmB [Anaerolineae bacterium]
MRETLFGRQAVRESLRAGRRQPFRLLVAEGALTSPIIDEIVALAGSCKVPVTRLSRREMESFTGTEAHQGLALETSGYPYVSIYDMLDLAQERGETPLLLLLDLIQDIHNLGSLIRTAEAVGAHGVIIQGRRAAGVTPATVNTSSGAVEHMYVAQVTNLSQTIDDLKTLGVWIAGLEDVYGAKAYTEVDLTAPLGLVVGSEADGLRRLVRERCDWLLALPMRGQINSLNAAVAGSIALYEVLRQRSLQG